MSEGYNFLERAVTLSTASTTHTAADTATIKHHVALVSVLLVAGVLLLVGFAARAKLQNAKNALIPEKRLTLRTFFEVLA